MNGLSNLGKVIVVAVVAAILIIVAIVYNTGAGSGGNGSNGNSSAIASSTNSDTVPADTATLTTESPAQVPSQAPKPTVIHFITPVKNDIWKIGTQDMISWNVAGGISGSLSLIDAATGQFIGTILPQVGPNQTSYTWNTLDLLLDRTSPLGKNVVPGTYEIRIAYDGNGIQPTTSPAFTITN